ncbi:hypothetical protein B1R32_1287 [Abditibacterium utsteinense]|uniref:Uncharacterized protein n=1 Tax=Abditibacterium utsteinense TaxID=1960156 RepID=A0A2S8SP51_9BACT|nr:hypothetical protein B1R32_1287 [Abditibacterium utsteinense]
MIGHKKAQKEHKGIGRNLKLQRKRRDALLPKLQVPTDSLLFFLCFLWLLNSYLP